MQGLDLQSDVRNLAGSGPHPAQRRKAILVVGMSRSGTSLITHILHTLGATLPDDLIGPDRGNPFGHWEPRALVDINDRILSHVGLAWDDPRPLPAAWFRSGEAHEYALQIMGRIEQDYAGSRLLLIKDPRLCRLLPLYCEALDMLDIELTVVLAVRPVAQVVCSLVERDGTCPALAGLAWLRSVADAEWHSRHCKRIWLGFAQVMADWRTSIHRVTQQFDLTWPVHPADAAERVASLLQPRSHNTKRVESRTIFSATPFVRTWDAIEAGIAGDEAAAQAGFDAVRAWMQDADWLYAPIVKDLMRRHAVALRAIQESTSWRLTAPLRELKQRAADFARAHSGHFEPAQNRPPVIAGNVNQSLSEEAWNLLFFARNDTGDNDHGGQQGTLIGSRTGGAD
jgi:hypothetical protein